MVITVEPGIYIPTGSKCDKNGGTSVYVSKMMWLSVKIKASFYH
ncbi:hypothetical protein QN344_06905 [Mucilaginibacter sp. 5B2]|nr:hypothetical protein [Mucilaginibacter sp. 5B2]